MSSLVSASPDKSAIKNSITGTAPSPSQHDVRDVDGPVSDIYAPAAKNDKISMSVLFQSDLCEVRPASGPKSTSRLLEGFQFRGTRTFSSLLSSPFFSWGGVGVAGRAPVARGGGVRAVLPDCCCSCCMRSMMCTRGAGRAVHGLHGGSRNP